jgi:hypothetical protein
MDKTRAAIEAWIKSVWTSAIFSWTIIVGTFACCVWFWFWPPLPGVAVAILGAAAAIMTFRDMQNTHKMLATIAIFALMGIELNDIRRDRQEADRQATEQRKRDKEAFGKIASGIDSAIKQSQDQFSATMEGLTPTLEASRRAMENTRPRADVECAGISLMSPFAADAKLKWNVAYVNSGAATAENWEREGKIYVGTPDDLDDQRRFGAEFDKTWVSDHQRLCQGEKIGCPAEVKPKEPNLFTFDSEPLNMAEVESILSRNKGRKTIYILVRFVWSDETGTWANDSCMGFQDPPPNLQLAHPCSVHRRGRYAFRRSYR